MITQVNGDLLTMFKDGQFDAIVHQANTKGIMGGGIALQIKDQFPSAYDDYKLICNECSELLTNYARSDTEHGVIFHLFGQSEIGTHRRMTNYAALSTALMGAIDERADEIDGTLRIGIPYQMGCGLGGGDWDIVSQLIEDTHAIFQELDVDLEITIVKL